MMDKRSKGCPNDVCKRNNEHYLYKATDLYCTICGTELVFVCPKCFGKLADQGPEHIICSSCEAEKEDRKNSFNKKLKSVGNSIENGAHSVGDAVNSGKKAIKEFAEPLAASFKEESNQFVNSAKSKVQNIKENVKKKSSESK